MNGNNCDGKLDTTEAAGRRGDQDAGRDGSAGGLTHRAVDQRAGLAEGSWSYHFTIWQVLLRAAADRLAEVDIADATTLPLTGTASAEKPR
ncbi:hypothetical protein ACFVZR_36965 [Streptomyces sp. NPDC058316]|uniref:hypothetical protein n=1 Tax=unclassified Streptomyces TaxID=2593676 RepID=UPI0034353B94